MLQLAEELEEAKNHVSYIFSNAMLMIWDRVAKSLNSSATSLNFVINPQSNP